MTTQVGRILTNIQRRRLAHQSPADVSTSKTTFLVFGQTKIDDEGVENGTRVMELLAARRKIRLAPGKEVVRPGDPLPRGVSRLTKLALIFDPL
jgi:hypothetical protein